MRNLTYIEYFNIKDAEWIDNPIEVRRNNNWFWLTRGDLVLKHMKNLVNWKKNITEKCIRFILTVLSDLVLAVRVNFYLAENTDVGF